MCMCVFCCCRRVPAVDLERILSTLQMQRGRFEIDTDHSITTLYSSRNVYMYMYYFPCRYTWKY